MARMQRNDPPDAYRGGPYETSYDVVRGYEAPPPAPRTAARPAPEMVAARRADRHEQGPYGSAPVDGTASAFVGSGD